MYIHIHSSYIEHFRLSMCYVVKEKLSMVRAQCKCWLISPLLAEVGGLGIYTERCTDFNEQIICAMS